MSPSLILRSRRKQELVHFGCNLLCEEWLVESTLHKSMCNQSQLRPVSSSSRLVREVGRSRPVRDLLLWGLTWSAPLKSFCRMWRPIVASVSASAAPERPAALSSLRWRRPLAFAGLGEDSLPWAQVGPTKHRAPAGRAKAAPLTPSCSMCRPSCVVLLASAAPR